jgi:hypothetical protein
MKNLTFKICLSFIISTATILEATCQLTLTTVSDPLLGSTKIKGVSRNQLNETLLLSGKKIYTYIDQVTDVYTCSLCNDIRDVAMVGDTMYIASDGAGTVKRFGDSIKVVTTLRSDRLVSGNGGKLYGVNWMDGLNYWDGSSWKNLITTNSNIPTNDIYDVILDHNGLLWIASHAGLISFDGTNFSLKSSPGELSETFYDVNVDSDNAIWVASAFGGVGKYSGGNWTTFESTFNPLERVENLAVLNGTEIWTSETSLGFYRYTGTFNTIPFASLGATEWYPNDVLYSDAQNRLWIQNQFTALRYLTTGPSATSETTLNDQGIILYPNPAIDYVHLECSNKDNSISEVGVYSIEGKLIYTKSIQSENQVELSTVNWQSGIYFLKVKAKDGLRVLKLVK